MTLLLILILIAVLLCSETGQALLGAALGLAVIAALGWFLLILLYVAKA